MDPAKILSQGISQIRIGNKGQLGGCHGRPLIWTPRQHMSDETQCVSIAESGMSRKSPRAWIKTVLPLRKLFANCFDRNHEHAVFQRGNDKKLERDFLDE